MKKPTSHVVAHALPVSLPAPLAGAQQTRHTPPTSAPEQPSPDDEVVRITTELPGRKSVLSDE